MKKNLLFFLLLCIGALTLPTPANAQNTLTVADGTTTNRYVPVYGYYADAYLRCQTIYTADALDAAAVGNSMNGGTITGLTYYLSTSASDPWIGTWEVKMMEVPASSLSGFVDMTNATTVYTGTLNGTSSTLSITLTTPYTYQGGNLLIEVSQTTNDDYYDAYFYGVSATGASWQGYSYSTWSSITGSVQNFIPKTTFTYIPGSSGPMCFDPTGLTSSVTASEATISWNAPTAGDSPQGYQVCCLPSTDVFDAATATWTAATDTFYTFTNLIAGTTYTAHVRSVCGTDFYSNGNASVEFTPGMCVYTFNLVDAFGDGWNGNKIEVSVNGNLLTTLTISSGFSNTVSLMLPDVGNLELTWVEGSYSGETSFTVTDPFGAVVYSCPDGSALTDGATFYTGTVNCTPPACPKPTGVTVSNVTSDGATLTWTASGTPDSFEVEYGPEGFAPGTGAGVTVTVPATATTTTLTGVPAGIVYTVYVRAICGNDASDWTTGVPFSPGSYTMNATGWDTLRTCSVVIYDDGGATGEYSGNCNTYLVVYPDAPGRVVQLSGTVYVEGGSYDNLVIYDGVGTTDELERFDSDSPVTISTPITSTTGPLTIYFFSDGSVFKSGFELIVNCVSSTCFPPTGIHASVTTNSAIIEWDEVAENHIGYQAEWNGSILPDQMGNPDIITGTLFSFSGLTSGDSYTVRVRTVCAAGDTSAWSDVYTFQTDCPPITSLPYIEGFESAAIPTCWKAIDGDGDGNNWVIWSNDSDGAYSHSGNNNITSFSYDVFSEEGEGLTPNNWLISPSFTLPTPCNLSLVWYAQSMASNWPEPLDVLLSTTGRDTAAFTTTILSLDTVPGVYTQYTYSLANYAGQTVTFAFVHRNVEDMLGVNLDDMGVVETPEVVTSDATAIATTTATLNGFVNGNNLSAYGFEWKATADADYTVDTLSTGTQTGAIGFNLANLTPNTTYTFRTFANDENGFVFYGVEKTFTTEQLPCPAPANLTVADINTESARLTWASQLPTTGSYNVYLNNTLLTQTPVSELTYLLTGLTPGTSYDVTVAMVCNGTEGPSETRTFSTPCIREGIFAIGDTNSTLSYYYLPLNTYFNYSYTQQLFLASEMGRANIITNIAFNLVNTASATMQNVKIYLGHTTKNEFASNTDTIPFSALTEVYSGDLNFSPGWNTFELDQPFAYNGNDNLVLALFDNVYDYPGSSYKFLCASTGDNYLALDYYSDSQIPNPTSLTSYTGNKYRRQYHNVVKFGYCDNSTCVPPMVSVGNVTAHDAEVSWTPGYHESAWGMQYKGENDNDWTTVTLTPNSPNPYSLSNLTPNTAHTLRMWSICGDSELSDTTQTTFSTLPTCVAPTGLAVSAVTANDATLTWTAIGTPVSFEVEYDEAANFTHGNGTSVIVPAVATTATQTTSLANLAPNRTYAVYVRAICGAGDTSTWSMTTFTTPCGTETMPWSENFDNWTSKSPCWSFLSGAFSGTPTVSSSAWGLNSSYGNYITISGKALTMNVYSTYNYWAVTPPINITSNTAMLNVDVAVSAYSSATTNYDANDTLAFAITTDNGTTYTTLQVFNNTELNALGNAYTTLSVPVSGYNGQTVRFAIFAGSAASGGDNRIVIDNVSVDEAPSCLVPTGVDVNSVTATTATLTWTPGGNESAWDIYVPSTSADVPGVNPDNMYSIIATSYTVTDLPSNSICTLYVRANCGNEKSNWVSKTFTTPCGTINVPYTENFESYSSSEYPACWSRYPNYSNTSYPSVNTYSGHLSSNSLYFYSGTASSYMAILPELSLGQDTAMSDLWVTFYYSFNPAYNSSNGKMIVGVMEDPTHPEETFTPVDTVQHTAPTTWEFQKVRLTNYTGNGKYIAFKNLTTASYAGYFIDDVTVELMPSCMEPENLAITDMTNTSATLTWTPGNTETLWEVGYVQSDVEPVAMPTNWESTTTPSYTFTGLTPLTTYTAYVRSNCGNDGVSNPVSFNFTAGTYTMGTVRSLTTCQAVIYDDGGADGNYSSYRNDTLTIYPEVQGNLVQVSGFISVEGSSWDYLDIYDGAGTTDLLLHDNSNVRPHTIQTITSTTGPLTLYFKSDSGTEYAGLELFVTCVPPCEAPSEVVGTTISNNQSNLTFGYDQQAQGINLELQYKATNATSWSSSISVQDITYTLMGLDNNTTYDVRVRSVCGNADAQYYSEWVNGTIDIACPAPSIPDATYYDYDATTVILSWDYTGSPTFNVMRVEGNNTTIIDMAYEDDPENYFADDLTPNTEYTFYVRSICNNGLDTSAWSNPITFTTPETCPTPTGLTASDVTVNGATLTWTATGTPDGFEVEYGPAGFVHGDGSTVTVPAVATTSMQTTPLTNLTSNTSYEVYVRAVCGNDHSDWSLVASFTTLCDAVTLPYTETFESNSSAINCWSTEGPGSWTIGTGDYTSTGSYQGTQNALITHTYTGNVTKFISPVLDGVQNGLRLDFAYLMRSWSGDLDELRIYSRSAAGGTWQLQATYTDETVTWTAESITIPGAVYQVAFEHTDNYGYGLGIDSVVFTPISADFCYAVTNLAVDSVTGHTARISWMGDANSYTILDMAGGSVVATQADTTYKFTNLASETQYTFGVVANCTSSNSDTVTVTFTTLISCPAPTGLTAEIVETDGIMFSVNGGGNAEGYQVEYGEIGFTQGQGTIVYELADATTQTFIAIDNLNANTIYDFYVRAICGVGDTSAWSPVTTTATACGAVTLPYTETFERTSGTRDCWELVASANIGGNNGMGFFTMNGRPALRFSSYSSASDYNQYGFSPLMNVSSSATNLKVKVTYATYGSSDILNFGYVTSTDTVWDSADYTTTGSSDWQTAEFIIPATATQVAIHYFGSYSWYAWIDTVAVTELTGEYCYAVTNLAVDSVTGHTARISWVGDANSYTILDMAGGSVVTTQADTTYKFTNLASETQYTFGVVANCTSSNSDTVTVTFTTLISCPAPTGLTAELVETTEIMFSVNGSGNVQGYQVEYGATGFAHGQGSFVYEAVAATTNQPLIVVDNLTANTTYDFYVRAICGTGDTSAWSGVTTERTACGVIGTLPYTENFNSYTGTISTSTTTPTGYPDVEMPSCWKFPNRSTTTSTYPQAFLTSSSTYAVDGNCLFFKSSSATPLYAVLPLMSEDIDNLQVTFTYRNEGTTTSNGTLHVGYMTDPMDASTYVDVYTCEQTTTKTEETVRYNTVTPSQNTTYYIAFKYEGGTSSNFYLSIDDVMVDLIPSCPASTGLTAELVETTEMMFSVNGGGSAEGYQVEYGETGFTQGQGTIVYEQANATSQTLIVVDGLSAATTYDFYVRAICGVGDTSVWSSVTTETTACNVISTFPYTENFDAVATGTLPVCWTNTNDVGETDWEVSDNPHGSVGTHSGDNVMNFFQDSDGDQTSLQMPTFDLTSLTNPMLGFWYTNKAWAGDYDELNIYYRASSSDAWTQLASYTTNMDTWTYDSLALPNPSATYQIKFEGLSNYGHGINLDDIVVKEMPVAGCFAPTDVTVSNETYNSADVSWTDNANYTYELQYREANAGLQQVDTTFNFSQQGYSNAESLDGVTVNIDDNITFVASKNTGENEPKYYDTGSALRIYGGNKFVVTAANGAVITGVEIQAGSGSSNHPDMNYVVDNSQSQTSTASNAHYNVNNINAGTVTFTNPNTSGHLRMETLTIHYTLPGTESTWTAIVPATSPTTLDNLTPETDYEVRVRTICAAGDTSDWSNVVPFSTEEFICGAPVKLSVNDITMNSAEVVWSDDGTYPTELQYKLPDTPAQSVGTTFDFSQQGYTNAQNLDGVTINIDNNIAFVANRHGGTAPAYYTSGSALRFYGKNNFVVTANNGVVITGIEIEAVDKTNINWSSDDGQTGSINANEPFDISPLTANTVTVTNPASSGHMKMKSLTVHYTILGTEGTWISMANVTSPVQLTGLMPNTNYSVRLRNICSASDTSVWTNTDFTTLGCQTITNTLTETACNSFTWDGTTYTTSGEYTKTYTLANGCDSVVTLNLTVNNSRTNTLTETACDSFTWDGTTYTTTGNYVKTYTAANGCDSVVTLHLTVNNSVTKTLMETACDSFIWAGTTYTTTGNYVKTYMAANGCDSTVTLHLTVNNSVTNAITETACNSYTWAGTTYTTSGEYVKTFTAANGCDSTVTLNLTINTPRNTSTTIVACGEYTWTEGTGQTYTVGGHYYYSHNDANGCTQVDTLHLTIQPATNVTIMADHTDILLHESVTLTASGAAQYLWNTNDQTSVITVSPTATGNYTYSVTGKNVLGTCPTTAEITIHVDECMPARSTETIVACDSFAWHGTVYTASTNTPTYTIPNGAASGCDSIVTLHLTINNSVTNSITEVACDSFVWAGTTYTTSNDYVKTFTAVNGCDSVVTLHLIINNTVTNSITEAACGSFVWDGTTYTASGDYVKTYTAANSCDSVVTLHLTINNPTHVAITETACGSYTWVANNNTVYTQSGTYTYSHSDANGCTQVDTLHLTINAIPTVTVTGDDAIALYESATMTASGADTYVWNTGAQTATITVTPTAIGTATYTVVGTTNNCVSEPATFNVVVGRCRPATYVETIVACDSYTWHGTTYTASTDTATYTVVDGAASGCDSIVTLHLTINNSVTNAINEVACDSYMWDGTTYTTSGDYVKTYTAANGCDSTVTLHLTINNSVTNAITEVACDSYTWNDSLYMVSGDYVQTLQTSAGCDSVVTLHLTVNNSVTSEFTENVCGSYTWNNVNYTQSGNYTQNFTAANGCDSTVTLHLTVRPIPQVYVSGTTAISRYQSTTLTAHGADSYLWNTQATTASITVTPLTSSSYSVVGTTDGCSSAPSIVTVYVGDCIPAQGTETVSACESYEWHGVTYTQSTTLANAPTYTIRSGAANGCDSVVSLVLTIYRPTHTASTITECNSYTWHGTAYTESGTYTYSHPDAHGCTQVDTLHLTIIKPQNLAYEVSSCGTYYWHNQPRRRTGTYLYTYADDNGCMKTDTLYLTVYTPVHQGYNVSACDSYEWFGHTYNRTGVYLYAHPDEHGCEQVDTLHLTINHSVAKEITDTGCGSFTWNNSVYTQSGNYTQTFTTAAGCDSVVTLHLTIYPVVTMNSITGDTLIHEYESATLVANATGATSYEWVDASTSQVVGTAASITVSPMTTTTYSVVASNGHCASPSMSVTVRVLPCIPAQGVENVTACGSYEWHGVTYTQSTNTPTYTYERLGGCDSVVTLNLTINNPVANELTLAACDAYTWNNVEYTTSGDYTQTFTAANGCDSVVTLHLTINNAVAHEFSATGCGQYAWDNTVYNQSGDYVKTYTAANGCDSVVTLHLTIYPMPVITSVTGDTNIYEYESTTLTAQGMNVVEYTWVGQGVGQTLTVSPMQTTTYTVIGTSADQCVSTEYVVTVHVLPCIPAQGVENVTACGSYEWHGVTYTQSTTTPTYTYERQGVCDSIVTLHLTINNPAAEEFAAVECDAYMWNNVEYTQSGDYTQTFTAANGCDSVVTLHLTINNSVATEFSDTGCGQYVWDNTVYTQSGNYVKQYTTAAGCDSVVTLHLTIYPIAVITNVTGNTVIREYESATLTAHGVNVAEYTWVGQGVGQTLTVSPMQTTTYTVIGTSANNCASAEYQVTVHVLPCVPVQSVENVTACGSYEWHGVTYTQSTNTPTYIFERLGGCDSVVTLHLTIYNPQNGSMNAQTCDDNYWWNGQNYTQSGTYTYEHQDDHGCTVVDTLHLTIMTPQHASLTASACGSYWWNGQNYTQSGTYTYSFVNQNGCTQVDTLHLTINQPAVYEFSAVACEEYAWGNSVYNHSGDYVKHFTTAAGCDSLVTLHLTINLPAFTEISATSCGSYTWNDEVYTQSGNYTQSFSTVAGCDSTVVLHLTIHNPQPRTYTAFNCGSYTWNGMTYMQSGTYTYEHPDQNGCTQVDTLHLTIGNPVATEFNATECVSYTWNNQVYYASGTYMQTLHTADGCDSVVTLHLTILNPDFTVVNETACNSYTWNGQTYTQSGRYMANLHNVNGCDSTVVLNLTVRYSITNDVYATACGDYVWNNVKYTQTGAYTQTFTAANGCDSVVTLHLTIHNPQHQSVTDSECGVYMWNNTLYTQSGTYTYAHLDQNGCMQVDTLHLTIYNPVNEIFTINACDSYTWFGTTYTQSGVYTHSHADAHGCTQIDTLNLTIYSTEPVVYNVDACGTYIWHGMFYTQSGTYTYRYFNNAGCEQTEVLNLTVHTPQHQSVTVSECGFYTWNNTVYTQSGTYTFAHFDNNGCTQVDTLHLTIYTPQHAAVTVTECNAYTWHNTLYTQSGVYTYQHADVHGCTQVDTLHLTILPAPVGHVVTVSECGSYTWYGQTYTQSGTYYHNFVNNSGCVGVDTLHLTIYTPQHTAITVVECESYIWNNTLYTQSGTYTYAHLDQNGCVQVDTLHLTLGQSQNIDLTMTECGSYTWHGQTYTQSGTYTYTLQGTAGCNHTETLHLIIFNPQHESFTAGDCNSYTWHGQTYTQSGNYYYSHLDANGCTQVDTLHLTIYNSQPQTFTVSECESYTWHGTTYTQSGTYTYTTFTANGCEQVETLHLTIHNPVHQSFTAEDCEYYTWHGVTYGQSGVYTYAHADNFGCMQVDTLHLTIHQPQHYDLHVADPGSSYTWNGVVYGQSGTYTQVLTDQFGCDSTVVLHLSLHTIGVEDYTLDGDVTVYPNPTRNRVTIGTTNMLSVEKLDIYDAYGKLLATVNVNDADAEVDLSTYAAGTYFIRITTDKGVVTKRVVKQQ